MSVGQYFCANTQLKKSNVKDSVAANPLTPPLGTPVILTAHVLFCNSVHNFITAHFVWNWTPSEKSLPSMHDAADVCSWLQVPRFGSARRRVRSRSADGEDGRSATDRGSAARRDRAGTTSCVPRVQPRVRSSKLSRSRDSDRARHRWRSASGRGTVVLNGRQLGEEVYFPTQRNSNTMFITLWRATYRGDYDPTCWPLHH